MYEKKRRKKKQSGVSEIKRMFIKQRRMSIMCRFRMTVHVFVIVALIPKKRDWHVLGKWKGEGK